MFNNTAIFMLHYQSKRGGGSCLPFDTVSSAVTHAKQRRALSFRLEERSSGKIVMSGTRPSARHRFLMVGIGGYYVHGHV